MGTPCVNVPGLADASGLPLGVQIVGDSAATAPRLKPRSSPSEPWRGAANPAVDYVLPRYEYN